MLDVRFLSGFGPWILEFVFLEAKLQGKAI
jgi:hypothetical protein